MNLMEIAAFVNFPILECSSVTFDFDLNGNCRTGIFRI
jgi:hypothetical protein